MNWSQPKVYAVKHKDEEIRAASRSGGIFTALSDLVLDDGGTVYGCVLTDDFHAVHVRTDSRDGRNQMRGSKYIQSKMGDTYKKVQEDLNAKREVLFSGTSCQVAGLKHFLGKDYDNLICIDIVCHALLIGLILILILKKSKINDTWIMLIGVVFFIAGIFVQKQLDVASVNGYAGFWKLYYMIWGKTIKNGVFMGMFYCMLGTLIQKIPQTKTVFICTISAFILYVVGVYFQYEWRKLLLPVVLVLVVESVIMLPLHIGSLGKWFRSMSTLLFLCHYIFVRAFECFPTLAVCFPEGIHKFMFVGVSAFLLSALLVWAGNKNKRIRWLWQ